MAKKLYSVDVRVCATAYIKASSKAEAQRIADGLSGCGIEVGITSGETPISDLPFSHPDLPDLSLSPAMTIDAPYGGVELSQ